VDWVGDKFLDKIFPSESKNERNEELEALNDSNINKFLTMKKNYMEKQKNKLIDEEKRKEQQKQEGTTIWNIM